MMDKPAAQIEKEMRTAGEATDRTDSSRIRVQLSACPTVPQVEEIKENSASGDPHGSFFERRAYAVRIVNDRRI